jgi:hypothetical protein
LEHIAQNLIVDVVRAIEKDKIQLNLLLGYREEGSLTHVVFYEEVPVVEEFVEFERILLWEQITTQGFKFIILRRVKQMAYHEDLLLPVSPHPPLEIVLVDKCGF